MARLLPLDASFYFSTPDDAPRSRPAALLTSSILLPRRGGPGLPAPPPPGLRPYHHPPSRPTIIDWSLMPPLPGLRWCCHIALVPPPQPSTTNDADRLELDAPAASNVQPRIHHRPASPLSQPPPPLAALSPRAPSTAGGHR